jgi:hypothetical protein
METSEVWVIIGSGVYSKAGIGGVVDSCGCVATRSGTQGKKLGCSGTPVRGKEGAYRVGGCAEYKQYNLQVCAEGNVAVCNSSVIVRRAKTGSLASQISPPAANGGETGIFALPPPRPRCNNEISVCGKEMQFPFAWQLP